MVAHVLRLRIALLLGAFRGDPQKVTRGIVGALLLLAATVAACWSLLRVQESSTAAVGAITIFCGATLTLAFAVAPIVSAVTDPLDPRRFRVFALAPEPLAGALALGGCSASPSWAWPPSRCVRLLSGSPPEPPSVRRSSPL